ncbi:MAG: DUF1697 domain-containing protein [Melioribacteraceae bacterium]
MNTYIALFRGINVGGSGILPMKDLSAILENLGCVDVKTYIQSGNVVFKSKQASKTKIAKEISDKVSENKGFAPKVMLLEIGELESAVKNNPFSTEEGKALHFFFLESEPVNPNLEKMTLVKKKSEQYKLNKKIFYLFTPEGLGDSKLAAIVEKCLGVPATARNWNTVSKLVSMVK